MAKSIKQMRQEIVNMSDSEKVSMAQSAVDDILAAMRPRLTSDEYVGFIANVIKLFVSADRNCTEKEYNFICRVYDLNMSYRDFYNMTNRGADSSFVRAMDDFIDSLPDSAKYPICLFGLCILASDDTITVAEQELFHRILG